MKRSAAIILAALCLALAFAGCDELGRLNENETHELYEEVVRLVASGELWQYEFEPFWVDGWESDEAKLESYEFVTAAVEKAFETYGEEAFYGEWYSSKRYCKGIVSTKGFSIEISYGSCIIDLIRIDKYTDPDFWRISIKYHSEDDETVRYFDVKFTP